MQNVAYLMKTVAGTVGYQIFRQLASFSWVTLLVNETISKQKVPFHTNKMLGIQVSLISYED